MADLVDRLPRYIEHVDLTGWESAVARFLQRRILGLTLPRNGLVVELGTARGHNFRLLVQHFGENRCRGYDVVNYPCDPLIRELDVRTLDDDQDAPIAFGWNDLSEWKLSPESKRAGLDFIDRNILAGGYYMDATLTRSAWELIIERGFKLIDNCGPIFLFRRP